MIYVRHLTRSQCQAIIIDSPSIYRMAACNHPGMVETCHAVLGGSTSEGAMSLLELVIAILQITGIDYTLAPDPARKPSTRSA